MKSRFEIIGVGMYLPPKIETSNELSNKINKSEEWIVSKTGVLERRVSDIDVDVMGAIAGQEAIGNNEPPELIINASGVPKQVLPDTSVFIQRELNLDGIPSFSIHSTCLSFITALNIAASLINGNQYSRILIVSADRGTKGRNFKEPESASLLGDAAAAIYIGKTLKSKGLISYSMETYPKGAELTEVRGGGTNLHPQDPKTLPEDNLFKMSGPKIFRMAFQKVYEKIQNDIKTNKLSHNMIDLLIPHQASIKAIKAYSKYGGFNEKQVMNILPKTGNCVAASLPLALVMAYKEDKINKNSIVYLIGTGAGLSIASAIIRI